MVRNGKPRILVLCDNPEVSALWGFALEREGLDVQHVPTTNEGLELWSVSIPDLIVIDAHSKEINAISFSGKLRQESVIPILYFSPINEEAHLLEAYIAGIDECVPKPVSPIILLAKVKAWLRRAWTIPAETLEPIRVGDLRLIPDQRRLLIEGEKDIRLTNLEFRLLYLLMSQPGAILEHDAIVQRVWGYYGDGDHELLKYLIHRLRRKIEPDPKNPRRISTEIGVGYRFEKG